MTLTESQKRGLITTVIFHAGVLLLLLYFGFVAPYPPPAEQGILLDFGNSETGLGLEEPSAGRIQVDEEVKPVPVPAAPRVKVKAPVQEEEQILTQDYEKTVAVKTALKKKANQEKKIKLEEERREKEELEKQRQLERLERQQAAEAERVKKEEAAKSLAINSRAKNAFGTGQVDNGSQSRGQGVTYGSGNQGSPDGTPGANQFGSGGGSGNGRGSGPSFSLAGRSELSLVKPNFPGNEQGTVVVEVTVDKFGKVTQARPGFKGSSTFDPDLLEAAKKAAMSSTFKPDNNAPAYQKGTITYHFRLQ